MFDEVTTDFVRYLLREWPSKPASACTRVTYSHSVSNKFDKKSRKMLTKNVITVKVTEYDECYRELFTISEHFEDGHIKRPKKNKLVNIAPAELDNKFAAAKASICQQIHDELTNKLNDITDKLNNLNRYCSQGGTVIPSQFIAEPMLTNEEPPTPQKKKFEF